MKVEKSDNDFISKTYSTYKEFELKEGYNVTLKFRKSPPIMKLNKD